MSTVIANASADVTSVVRQIEAANAFLEKAEATLNFGDRKLVDVCKDHAKNVYTASRHLNTMKALEEFFKVKLAEVESKHWKKYTENYARALSTKDIQAYIAGEPDCVAMMELQLEIVFVKRQLESIHEALKDLGWQIKYVTDLRIHELQDEVV